MKIDRGKAGMRSAPVLLIVFAALLAGCGGGSPSGASAISVPAPGATPPPAAAARPEQVEREILPSAVNSTLPVSDAAYFTINPDPRVTPRGRLFVMLPGTGAIPRNYRAIVRSGAGRGYHGIGLTYRNATAVGDLCAATIDPDCTGNTRREIITGEDVSTVVAVDRANAVVTRLAELLANLDRAYPAEGWGQFLRNGAVDWALVTVAGHSQGSGHAGYMAKLYNLDRVVMFSGPGDVPTAGFVTARWFGLPNVTPASRQFGFTHLDDELLPYALIRANWTAIGLPGAGGAPFLVDGEAAPFGSSNQLYTAAAPNALAVAIHPFPRHAAPVGDGIAPTDAQGASLFIPVWAYLAFP